MPAYTLAVRVICAVLNLLANATTLVKTGEGVLVSITINTKGATGNTLKIYDGLTASGTLLATIDTTASIGTLTFNAKFSTGLCIVIATGTAADVTVSYV